MVSRPAGSPDDTGRPVQTFDRTNMTGPPSPNPAHPAAHAPPGADDAASGPSVYPGGGSAETERELGRGRSGIVYAVRDAAGRSVARKVFASSGLTKLVQYLFLGTPNPYIWNRHAVRSALLRRRILNVLVELWFGTKLRVADAYAFRWNDRARAFELDCARIRGAPVSLVHPFSDAGDAQLADAIDNVLKPLQAHLIRAGFDGLVWQAGLGNPVALNNFLCEGDHGDGSCRWVWIDLESGVPALVPINPVDLLRFYLPKSLRHGRPLFDDVDIETLRGYAQSVSRSLELKLGPRRALQFHRDIKKLSDSQRRWKAPPRYKRAIAYRLARGAIDRGQARHYLRHPVRWYGRELCIACVAALRGVRGVSAALAGWLARLDWPRALGTLWRCLLSQQHRAQCARRYVAGRIGEWRRRGQLDERQAGILSEQLCTDESSAYLADFGMHLAVKPLVKSMEWGVLPALFVLGWVDEGTLAIVLLTAGASVRTLYTLGRVIQNALRGREKPWAALVIGTMPVFGNLAFPMQIMLSGTHADARVAQFILYDTFSRFGRVFPIWGGRDTYTEHVFNRVAGLFIRRRPRRLERP